MQLQNVIGIRWQAQQNVYSQRAGYNLVRMEGCLRLLGPDNGRKDQDLKVQHIKSNVVSVRQVPGGREVRRYTEK